MPDSLQHLSATPVFVCAPDGTPIRGEREAVDVVGEGSYLGATWTLVPVERLADDFFRLRTRVAGDIVQKFATYGMKLAVVGDISRHTEASDSLQDFVRESNRGTQLWFAPDEETFLARLSKG